MNIPFVPMPVSALTPLTRRFSSAGARINKWFPSLKSDLYQAGIDIPAQEYGALIAAVATCYFILFAVLLIPVFSKIIHTTTAVGALLVPHYILLGLLVAFVVALLAAVQILAYPRLQIKKKVRDIEANLVFALRTMLVQIKSGVSLFNSLSMIATSQRFGKLGGELKLAVDNINTGVPEALALEEIARKNPSAYLRKALWQILNGMKAGADIGDVLTESVSTMVREQRIAITKYGGSLRMLSLVYLMIGVILPALGITFLIVIGSFPKIQISELFFWGMLFFVVLIEFMFVGVMKAQRPGIMGDE